MLGHMDPEFLAIMDDTMARLRTVFRTANALTFPVSGTGSAGMETCFVNLLEAGGTAIVGAHGVFWGRMCGGGRPLGGGGVGGGGGGGRPPRPPPLLHPHPQRPH